MLQPTIFLFGNNALVLIPNSPLTSFNWCCKGTRSLLSSYIYYFGATYNILIKTKNRASPRSALLEAVYLEALLYTESQLGFSSKIEMPKLGSARNLPSSVRLSSGNFSMNSSLLIKLFIRMGKTGSLGPWRRVIVYCRSVRMLRNNW